MLDSRFFIETERLFIRPFSKEDIEPSYHMNLDAEVTRFTGDGGVVSKQEIERRIREHVFRDYETHGFGRLAVELKTEKKFIGFTGLKYLEDIEEVDLGYRFQRAYWGRGIATEAALASLNLGFKVLGFQRIVAMVLPENKASVRVLKKLYFQFEKKILEDHVWAELYALDYKNFSLHNQF